MDEKKKPSGAEFARRRKLAADADFERQKIREKQGAEQLAAVQAAYKSLGPPPTDPTVLMIYAAKHAGIALWDAANDVSLTSGQKRKEIAQLVSVIGMTHSKTVNQAKIEKVAKKVDAKKDPSGELDSFDASISIPADSRLGEDDGGDQPLLGSVSSFEESQDEGNSPDSGESLGSPGEEVGSGEEPK